MITEKYTPLSRFEEYMKNTLLKKGTDGLPKPLSRSEVLLWELCELISRGEGGGSGGGSSNESITYLTLHADDWVESDDKTFYTQDVSIPGVTAKTKIDLQPSPEQLATMMDYGINMLAVNNNRAVKVYSMNGKLTEDMTIQATMKEVSL